MPHNQDPPSSDWPPLSSAYQDQYGLIDPDVYAAADKLWSAAKIHLRRAQVDLEDGKTLMFRAVAQVTDMMRKRAEPIENLGGYLWVTFHRLMLEEVKKKGLHSKLDTEYAARFVPATRRSEDEIINIIQVKEIRERADEWLRQVLDLYLMGHTFEEIAGFTGERANGIRARFSRQMRKLAKEVRGEKE